MSDDWPRVRQVAALAYRALMPAAMRALFDRAFQRDVTVTGYRANDVFETLGIACRRSLRGSWLPGRLVVAADDDRDDISPDAIDHFADRGGTLVCEAKHGQKLAVAVGSPFRPTEIPGGRREVSGPAIDRLPWKPAVPIAWLDAGAGGAAFRGGEVLVRDHEGFALVTRVPLGRGSLVHLAWQTVPFEREAPTGTLTTHRALAAQLGIPPRGMFSTDTPIDFDQVCAAMLAFGVLADLAAAALATSAPSPTRSSPSPSA